MYYGITQLSSLTILAVLICNIDMLTLTYYARYGKMWGEEALTSFCANFIIFSVCRDFLLITILTLRESSIKLNLRCRLYASIFDAIVIVFVIYECFKELERQNNDQGF